MVLVASCSGRVFGFDIRTGETGWEHDLASGFHALPVVDGDTWIVPVDDGTVSAFDVSTGMLLWQQAVGPPARIGGLLLLGDRVVGASNGVPFALSTSNGDFLTGGPAVEVQRMREQLPTSRDGIAVFVMPQGSVEAVEVSTGRSLWEVDLGAVATTDVLAVPEGFVVGSEDGRVSLLEATDGSIRWSHALDEVLTGGAVLYGGSLISRTQGGSVMAVDLASGKTLWERNDRRFISPRLLLDVDEVLVGSVDGLLAALAPTTGESVWERQLRGVLKGFARTADRAFVGNENGEFFAVRIESVSQSPSGPGQ